MTAYATIDDATATFTTAPSGERKVARLESALEVATDELNGELGQDFFRHPTAGSDTWLVNGRGDGVLHLHRGIVALEQVELSLDGGFEFVVVDASEYSLGWDLFSSDDPPAGEPWFHLRMRPRATYPVYPRGTSTVRLTGARGWPAIPRALIEGVAARARQIVAGDGTYGGSFEGDPEGGATPYFRWPDITWRFIQREKQRFYACSL